MTKRLSAVSRYAAWLICVLNLIWGISLIAIFPRLSTPSDAAWCGNVITHPLQQFLNFGVPSLVGAIGVLVTMSVKGFGTIVPVTIIASLLGIVSGVVFGLLYAYVSLALEGIRVADLIWWLL